MILTLGPKKDEHRLVPSFIIATREEFAYTKPDSVKQMY